MLAAATYCVGRNAVVVAGFFPALVSILADVCVG